MCGVQIAGSLPGDLARSGTVAIAHEPGVVFTVGIGEHAPAIRASVCHRLTWLGIWIDTVVNQANAFRISTAESTVEAHVLATDEDATIARHTRSLVQATARPT